MENFFSRNVQLFDESPSLDADNIFIGSHVSHTIIDWLTHNNARNEIILRFIYLFIYFITLSVVRFIIHVVIYIVVCLLFIL